MLVILALVVSSLRLSIAVSELEDASVVYSLAACNFLFSTFHYCHEAASRIVVRCRCIRERDLITNRRPCEK